MSYANVPRDLWELPAVRKLTPRERLLLLYLWTSPQGSMIGVFVSPPHFARHYTGLSAKVIVEAIDGPLSPFLDYDAETEEVFIFDAARYQIANTLKPDDKRFIKVCSLVSGILSDRIRSRFLEVYADWNVSITRLGARKGLARGLQGASKGDHTEADAEADAEADGNSAARGVFDAFVEERKRHVDGALNLKPTKDRLSSISARLAEGLTPEQATDVARGIFYAENHVRDRWKDSSIGLAFRSMEHCERFMRAFQERPSNSSDDDLARSRAEGLALQNAGGSS